MSVTLWTWSTSFPPSSQSDRKFLHGSFFRVWGGGFLVGWFCFKFFVGFFGVFWGFGLVFCGLFFFLSFKTGNQHVSTLLK